MNLLRFSPLRCAALFFGGLLLASSAVGGDTLFFNGTVLSMDAAGGTFDALGVRDGRIVAVGKKDNVAAGLRPGFAQTDLRGRTVLPGFYAAHDHFPDAGLAELYQVDLNSPPIGGIRNMEQLVAALKRKADATPPGEWVVGWGYDDTLLAEARHPTHADLDLVSPRHPVWIVHVSGHLAVANSRALEIAGVTKATGQPRGGRIRLDPQTGEPNGVFEEAGALVGIHIPGYTPEQRQAGIVKAQASYLASGVTTTVIAGATPETLHDLDDAVASGALRLRISALLAARSADRPPDLRAPAERIHLTGVKMRQDGSLQGYTGYISAPYFKPPEGQTDYRGYPARPREELIRMVADYHRKGLRIAIHGNGDAAIDDILDAFAAAQKADPRPDSRHRIEHCQTAREDQLARMAQLGVTPSFFVGHVYYWGDRHRDIFLGPERAARISPLAGALQNHLRFTVHNDTPVTPVNPLLLVWAAVNRLTSSDHVLGKAEAISVMDALRSVTSEAAWQNFEEKDRGSLEPGKLADFILLDRNPLTVPPLEIRDVKVIDTFIGGTSARARGARESSR
ncbi:MAG: amidohydrolase [Chthoniobacter sp.]|nr:amidohydrolase [Chthoniobacter sp.]